jgi:hypothetical protein
MSLTLRRSPDWTVLCAERVPIVRPSSAAEVVRAISPYSMGLCFMVSDLTFLSLSAFGDEVLLAERASRCCRSMPPWESLALPERDP